MKKKILPGLAYRAHFLTLANSLKKKRKEKQPLISRLPYKHIHTVGLQSKFNAQQILERVWRRTND